MGVSSPPVLSSYFSSHTENQYYSLCIQCPGISDRPLTFLFNTLHYYEAKLRDKPLLKRKLVNAVLGSLKDVRPSGWATTEAFQSYLNKAETDTATWTPDLNYYLTLVNRMVDSILFIISTRVCRKLRLV